MLTVKIVLSSVAPPCEQIGSRLMNVKWFDFVKLKLRQKGVYLASEKEIPCTMATFCGKKVQLSNVRARFMTVKPASRWSPNPDLEQAHSERGQDSDWEICCDPTEDSGDSATGIATVIISKKWC